MTANRPFCRDKVVDTMLGVCYTYSMKNLEIVDIAELKRLNKEAGLYWFSPDTTRIFKSRYPLYAYKVGDVAYFVTSEQNEQEPRRYTIRVFHYGDNSVDTVGHFNRMTSGQAQYCLKRLI